MYLDPYQLIEKFKHRLLEKHKNKFIKVIFTGAGTSASIGDTIFPYLNEMLEETEWKIMNVPTTDIISNPIAYFKVDLPTLLVSFSRSGNSPEDAAVLKLGEELVSDFYQLTLTCAQDTC